MPLRTFTLLLTTAGILAGPCPDPAAEGAATRSADATCVVESVTDGDTLRCEGGRRVRLLLIDTPEMNQPPYGAAAREVLLAMAPPGARLVMEFDVQREDRYRRTLAYLYDGDGRMLNEEMARSGYALSLVYPPNVLHVDRIRAAVHDARRRRAGLWATPAFECAPVDHRAGRCND